MIDTFSEEPGSPITAVVGPTIFFPKGKKQFVELAKKKYKNYKFADKLRVENISIENCRYDGINGRYYLGAKDGRGSFEVYCIDV
jgi:hypothetical protein